MTAIIDGASGPSPSRYGDQRQADEARQARWLFDLEQALFEQGLKPYRPAAPEAIPADAGMEAMPPKQALHAVSGFDSAPSAAHLAHAVEAGAIGGQISPQPRPAQPSALPAPAQDPAQGLAAGQPAAASALPQAAQVSPSGQPGRPAQPGVLASSGAPVQLAAVQPAERGPASAPQAMPEAAAASLPSRAAAPAQAALVPSHAEPGAMLAAEGDMPEAMRAAAAPETPGEPFEKKLLHLFYGRDGVHAWVRDAELQAGQMRSLAQNLAAELGGEGRRLASLTVNGRKLAAASGPEGETGETAFAEAPPQNTTRSIK